MSTETEASRLDRIPRVWGVLLGVVVMALAFIVAMVPLLPDPSRKRLPACRHYSSPRLWGTPPPWP
jgi:hypothetical protein